jgi:hypothetical protein
MDDKERNMLMFLLSVIFLNFVTVNIVTTNRNINYDIPCNVISELEVVNSELGKEIEFYFTENPECTGWVFGNEDTKRIIKNTAKDMIRHGMPLKTFRDITIIIFPLKSFEGLTTYFTVNNIPDPAETARSVGLTFYTLDEASSFIWLAGRNNDLTNAFAHEMGHAFSYLCLNAPGYDWSSVNEAGKEYLKIKKYPIEKGLDQATQENLPWERRIDEWFASDFESLFCGEDNIRAGPAPTPEVIEYFNQLFVSQRG